MTLRHLVLLRHGQTDYNATGRMQGHLDSHLTPEGVAQAERVAPEIARLKPHRIISSDLRRAADTADVVAAACGVPVEVDARLRETHLGDWQGRTVADIETSWPGAIATWRSDPAWAPPGGESRVEVVRRCTPVVEELDDALAEESEASTAVLVAHGGMIAGVVCGLLGMAIESWPAIGGLGNCRWASLSRRPDHPRWRLVGYNVGVE
ncbi:MAG: histidine phosphatase family protein [Pseudonocardiales bacterium]|nr:histidine phosphatase family protein [Pseudonocardiales bacterium]